MFDHGALRLPLCFLGSVAFTCIVCIPTSAEAFTGTVHNSMTRAACTAAGLPSSLCRRIAMEAENTDAHEWKDMRAHAQMSGELPMCDAANEIVVRLRDLGEEYRTSLAALSSTTSWVEREEHAGVAAAALGRALHTLQDNFAHQGVTNQQHGWYSLADFCEGTKSSPDFRPGAEEEARAMTEDFFAELALSLNDAALVKLLNSNACPVDQDAESSLDPCSQVVLPAPWELCNFLAESKSWDGIDRRWDSDIVSSALVDAFFSGTAMDLCSESTLELPAAAAVNVTEGIPTCTSAHLLCFGKVDDPGLAADEPAPATASEESGGCSIANGSQREGLMLAAAALALSLVLRRRRRG